MHSLEGLRGDTAVGVDGSDRSVPALERAAKEAAAHGHVLRVYTAWSIPVTTLSPGDLPALYPIDELESDGRAAQQAMIVKADMPADLVIEHHVVEGGPRAVLLDAAKMAGLACDRLAWTRWLCGPLARIGW
ncbi:MAG: hypothetical protein EXQ67_08435 [Thermoleophilia bacterium]|nr:hypothetical protein [Thermoleophilia bacterium]